MRAVAGIRVRDQARVKDATVPMEPSLGSGAVASPGGHGRARWRAGAGATLGSVMSSTPFLHADATAGGPRHYGRGSRDRGSASSPRTRTSSRATPSPGDLSGRHASWADLGPARAAPAAVRRQRSSVPRPTSDWRPGGSDRVQVHGEGTIPAIEDRSPWIGRGLDERGESLARGSRQTPLDRGAGPTARPRRIGRSAHHCPERLGGSLRQLGIGGSPRRRPAPPRPGSARGRGSPTVSSHCFSAAASLQACPPSWRSLRGKGNRGGGCCSHDRGRHLSLDAVDGVTDLVSGGDLLGTAPGPPAVGVVDAGVDQAAHPDPG